MNSNQKKILSMLMKSKKFAVATRGKGFQLIKMVGGKPRSVYLDATDDGMYWINPPSYTFHCSNSHYEFAEEEKRLTRNKSVIISLVRSLQETEVWDYIANKQFFVPNSHNRALKKDKNLSNAVFKQFDSIMKG